MRQFTETQEDEKRGIQIVTTFLERIMYATPNKKIEGWLTGKKYAVIVYKLWNGRYCIFKELGNSNIRNCEDSDKAPNSDYRVTGYKVYDTLEEIKQDFTCETDIRVVDRQERKFEKEKAKFNVA